MIVLKDSPVNVMSKTCVDTANFTKLSPNKVVPIVYHDYKYTTKTKMFSDEFNFFRNSSSTFFKKFKKKKIDAEGKREAEALRVMETSRHTRKASAGTRKNQASLSNKERTVFLEWFSARMRKYQTEKYGYATEIPIQYVIDDFMKAKVFPARSEAFEFLRFVDKDRNGSISINEFEEVFSDIDAPEHMAVIRKFIKLLEQDKFYNEDDTTEEGDSKNIVARSSCRVVLRDRGDSSFSIVEVRRHKSFKY
mmetsp:Transcript_21809/g.36759  ORF Transcript_21809/g.36759 Transcript_21809/m.36759 type:complete len:250 (+) Transcript_21809:80-829(+)